MKLYCAISDILCRGARTEQCRVRQSEAKIKKGRRTDCMRRGGGKRRPKRLRTEYFCATSTLPFAQQLCLVRMAFGERQGVCPCRVIWLIGQSSPVRSVRQAEECLLRHHCRCRRLRLCLTSTRPLIIWSKTDRLEEAKI